MKPDTYREHLNDLQLEVEELRAQLKEAQTGDTISRQAALDAVFNNAEHPDKAYEAIRHLPSAQPERKRGKWNWIGFNIECSECGCMPCFDSTEPLYNYCPNCGADMRGDEHE